MSCEFDQEILGAYALSVLEESERAAVVAHVNNCAKCKAAIVRRRHAFQMLENAFDEQPPEWLAQKIVDGLRHVGKKPVLSRQFIGIMVYGAIMVALLAGLVQISICTGKMSFVHKGIVSYEEASYSEGDDLSDETGAASSDGTKTVNKDVSAYSPFKSGSTAGARGIAGGPVDRTAADIQWILDLTIDNQVDYLMIYRELGVSEEIAGLLL